MLRNIANKAQCNLSENLKYAAAWGMGCGTATAAATSLVIGGFSTLVYYLKNDYDDKYSGGIEKGCLEYRCSYVPPVPLWTHARASCYAPYSGELYACEYEGHDICLENKIRDMGQAAYAPYDAIRNAETVKFMYTQALPITFGVGFAAGVAIGLCINAGNAAYRAAEKTAAYVSTRPGLQIVIGTVQPESKTAAEKSSPVKGGLFDTKKLKIQNNDMDLAEPLLNTPQP